MNQKHEEFRRLRTAGVPANNVNIVGIFIKALAWPQRDFFSPSHLHHDGALQHVNTHLRIVAVDRAREARRKVYGVHQNFLAGISCQSMRYDGPDSFLCAYGVGHHEGAGDEK